MQTFHHFPAVRDEFNHPFKLNLFGVITLTLLNMATISAFIDQTLATVVFWIAAPLQIFLTFFAAARWLTVGRGLADINPSYFIPIVGLAAIPVASVPAGAGGLGFLILGAAIVYWLLMFALQFLRIFFVGPLPRSALPLLFLAVAPPCLITVAYITLIQPAGGGVPVVPDVGAQLLFGIALFNTALFTMFRLVTQRVPFMLAHWAYVFPLCTFAIASQRYASIMKGVSGSANGLSTALVTIGVAVASIMWTWAAVSTIYLSCGRRLIAREAKVSLILICFFVCSERNFKVLSEETAEKVYQGKIVSSTGSSFRGTQRAATERDTMGRDTGRDTMRK